MCSVEMAVDRGASARARTARNVEAVGIVSAADDGLVLPRSVGGDIRHIDRARASAIMVSPIGINVTVTTSCLLFDALGQQSDHMLGMQTSLVVRLVRSTTIRPEVIATITVAT